MSLVFLSYHWKHCGTLWNLAFHSLFHGGSGSWGDSVVWVCHLCLSSPLTLSLCILIESSTVDSLRTLLQFQEGAQAARRHSCCFVFVSCYMCITFFVSVNRSNSRTVFTVSVSVVLGTCNQWQFTNNKNGHKVIDVNYFFITLQLWFYYFLVIVNLLLFLIAELNFYYRSVS